MQKKNNSDQTREFFNDPMPESAQGPLKDQGPDLNQKNANGPNQPDQGSSNQTNPEPESEDLKRKKIILIAATAAVAILLIIYFWGVIYFRGHFLPFTQINGIDVGGETPTQALHTLDQAYIDRDVRIVSEAGIATVNGAEIDLIFDDSLDELEGLVKAQDSFAWQIRWVMRHEIDLISDYDVDQDKLNSILNALPIVSGPDVVPPKDATIVYNGSEYVIDPAVTGDQPNVEKLGKAVINALIVGDKSINLGSLGLYNEPAITDDNAQLQKNLSEYNTAIKAAITQNFPTRQILINKDVFQPWLEVQNGTVTVNDNLNNYVASLANEFDTNGKQFTFNSTGGTIYQFTDTNGWILDQQGETDQLRSQILAGDVVTEDPDWTQRGHASLSGTDRIANNYIEIDLTSQHLWYYKNNVLTASTDIVSGSPQRGEASARGLFFLESKETNVSLSVFYPDGSRNTVTVQYWLPYSRYYGIESASFRTNFGGDIYKTQGTDGDIDVPVGAAQDLYNYADVGVPVVIY